MPDIFVKAPTAEVEFTLLSRLRACDESWVCHSSSETCAQPQRPTNDSESDILIYLPGPRANSVCLPCLEEAREILGHAASHQHVILVSSAAFYGAHHRNQGMLEEPPGAARATKGDGCIARAWGDLESFVRQHCRDGGIKLTVLRPTPVQFPGLLQNLTGHPGFRRVMGFNPVIQVLELSELGDAICCAVRADREGTYNIVPPSTQLLSEHLKSKSWLPSLPWFIRRLLSRSTEAADVLNFARYSWTVSGRKASEQLGFAPKTTVRPDCRPSAADCFGMSRRFIELFGRSVLWFMEKVFWRIEIEGLEHIPLHGKAVLAGFHRGFMPFDGIMLVHLLAKYRQRIPRFVIHPTLIKFPFLAILMARLGGVVACQKNAKHVLDSNEILGIFPEGIRGAFTMYRDAYSVSTHWRDDFARFAIEHQAAVIPVAAIGTADTFPILGRIPWTWISKKLEWPFFPMTPTFPLLPVPLPVKWHFQILPPIPVSEFASADASTESEMVAHVSARARKAIQSSVDDMLRHRPSLFHGAAFAMQPNVICSNTELNGLQPEQRVA